MKRVSIAAEYAYRAAVYEAAVLKIDVPDINHLMLGIMKAEDLLKLPLPDGDTEAILRFTEEEIRLFFSGLRENALDPVYAGKRLRALLIQEVSPKGKYAKPDILAENIVHTSGGDFVTLFDLFFEIVKSGSDIIERLFDEMSIIPEEVEEKLRLKQQELKTPPQPNGVDGLGKHAFAGLQAKAPQTFLDKYGTDLTKQARDGKLDRVIGRKEEIKDVARILLQKQKGNPLLIGEPGVGKTTIVEGLAQYIAAVNVSDAIKNIRIIRIDIAMLIAGAKYRGEFEEKLKSVISEASADKNIVLFIDEVHTLIGAGAAEGVAMDAANILKPALSKGDIRIIGATTTSEYKKFFEKDEALKRRFQTVLVKEPSAEDAIEMLTELKKDFESHHAVIILDEAIRQAVYLSIRFMPDLRLPDKAIEVIDRACSELRLGTITDRKVLEGGKQRVTEQHIAGIVAKRANLPIDSVTAEMTDKYVRLSGLLEERIAGQQHIIGQVAQSIQKSKMGFKDPEKPVGVFLFLGPTGTGKTYLAECLAEIIYGSKSKLIVFNMSEYNQPHTVAALIGAPPGYVGYQEEGQLAKRVGRNPASVVLFDEIEKADSSVLDIFLQMFDKGTVTNASGKPIDFTETIIILTSNIDTAGGTQKAPIGFHTEQEKAAGKKQSNAKDAVIEALKKHIRIEILNRIENILVFKPLSKDALEKIIKLNLLEINNRIKKKGISIQLQPEAAELIIQNSLTDEFGAREVKRVMNEMVVEPIVARLMDDKFKGAKNLMIKAEEGKFLFLED